MKAFTQISESQKFTSLSTCCLSLTPTIHHGTSSCLEPRARENSEAVLHFRGVLLNLNSIKLFYINTTRSIDHSLSIHPFFLVVCLVIMPGKNSTGFTKAGQDDKFIRHRDILLKHKEVRKEAHIQKQMIEGVCTKCRLKVEWRFKYDKYKPLKNPGSCQDCHNKTITKAYRTLCDPCAKRRHVCSSCCLAETAPEKDADGMAIDDESTRKKAKTTETAEATKDDKKISSTAGDSSAAGEGMEGVEDADEQIVITEDQMPDVPVSTASVAASDWDVRKFSTMASNKYSKNRVVGSESDSVFVFGEAPAPAPQAAAEPSMEESA
jgi:hypothetical protein